LFILILFYILITLNEEINKNGQYLVDIFLEKFIIKQLIYIFFTINN
jgi:hypothetical protein